jgi:hypothetical protein
LSLGRWIEPSPGAARPLERAAAAAVIQFVLRKPGAAGGSLEEALDHLGAAIAADETLWSAAVNRHWLARHLGRADLAERIAREATARAESCPFAAAYFSRERFSEDLLRKSPPAPDAHVRTELALAAMGARYRAGDRPGFFAAYATRMTGSDGDRDRQHVVIHVVDAMERIWADGRPGFGPDEFATEARAVIEREPGEVGHRWTLWSILTAAGRRRETIESLLASYPDFRDNVSHVDFLVACAWRVLEAAGPAKPN